MINLLVPATDDDEAVGFADTLGFFNFDSQLAHGISPKKIRVKSRVS